MSRLTLFVLMSFAIAWVSRASLRVPRCHGFYRFFAWEAILAVILLNEKHWLRDPFAEHQLVSWLMLAASLVLAVLGMYMLLVVGRPRFTREDDVPRFGIEKTTTLVTVGVYRYIRHPLYSSLLLLAWGTFLKDPSWLGALLTLAATAFLLVTAKVEEAENLRAFGPAYAAYMRRTKRFVPFLA